jgi:Integrase core domain
VSSAPYSIPGMTVIVGPVSYFPFEPTDSNHQMQVTITNVSTTPNGANVAELTIAYGAPPESPLPGAGAKSIPVAAASPWENGYIEEFHSRLRDEFLERVEFETVADAREKGKWFRRYYNAVQPHSSLDYATPKEFSTSCDKRRIGQQVNI